jgi:hypothetical protein
MTGDRFFLGTQQPGWLACLDVPLFASCRPLRTRPRLPRARERWALDSGGLIGPPSGPQFAALLTRRIHRQERLVQPANCAAGKVAVRVGLHQLPARAVLRGLRVIPRVDRHHRIQHGLQRDHAGHTNQVVAVGASVQQPPCRRQPVHGTGAAQASTASRHSCRRTRNRACCGIPSLTSERAHPSASSAPNAASRSRSTRAVARSPSSSDRSHSSHVGQTTTPAV